MNTTLPLRTETERLDGGSGTERKNHCKTSFIFVLIGQYCVQ